MKACILRKLNPPTDLEELFGTGFDPKKLMERAKSINYKDPNQYKQVELPVRPFWGQFWESSRLDSEGGTAPLLRQILTSEG